MNAVARKLRMMWTPALPAACLALEALAGTHARADVDRAAPLMRFPTSSATSVAFVARGDLWVAPRDGGRATRLVHGGVISTARFSPDGKHIAYTARQGGGQDVYSVPSSGGPSQRLTFDGGEARDDNLVSGWTPDGARVVMLSHRGAWAAKMLRAFTVPAGGGPAELLPVGESGLMSFAPDGRSVAFTRTFTNFAARKRYLGGEAQDIFTYDLGSHQLMQITDWRGTDTSPMWARGRVYFLSDRGAGFRANIWCYDLASRTTRQVTHFADYDIDWPSLGGDRITFQQGGRLWALDLPSERLHPLRIKVPDDGVQTRPRVQDVSREARVTDVSGAVDYALAPHGEAVLLSAHGDIFRIEAGHAGAAHDLTSTPAVDDEHPAWSPDGASIAYVTEASGAQQVALRRAAGGAERLLTHFSTGVLYTPRWAPDGRSLVVADAEHGLWWVSAAGGTPRLLARDPKAEIRDAIISPDGTYVAYSTQRSTGVRALHVQALASGRDVELSSPMESDRSPAYSADGRTLYFVSARHELPFTSDRGDEATVSTLKSDGVYAAPLMSASDGGAALDFAGAMSRAVALPVTPARITSLQVRGQTVLYETRPPVLIDGEMPGEDAHLHALDPTTGIDKVLLSGFDNLTVSADGAHALYRRDGAWRVASLTPAGADVALQVAGLTAPIDPLAQWAEIFERAWRLDRDLFFSRIMNGDDWRAVHDAYARLVPSVGSRQDLLYLLGELQGELATSHAFVVGLDADDAGPPSHTPRLGADLELDGRTGRYRFLRILRGDASRERFRSPLSAPGVDVRAGDYLLAVNGRELRAPTDPDALLAGAAGEVTLSVSAAPEGPRRQLHVKPLDDDLDLRQHDWVEANRARVAALTGGRVGYVFLADFDALGSEDLVRQLQPQLDKEGLVFDVRWNRGGFTSQAVLNLLKRIRAGEFVNREGALEPLPLFAAPRAMALIANASTASDGDQFTYFFRKDGLGPVVGQRTWGGVQGIKGPWPLMDGTAITIPKDSLASPDGSWLIENVGASPDVTEDPAPGEDASGDDRQLAVAAHAVAETLARNSPTALRPPSPLPAYPAEGDVPGAHFAPPSK